MLTIIAMGWLLCGLAALCLFILYWTREYDFTLAEGVIAVMMVAFGPVTLLLTGVVWLVTLIPAGALDHPIVKVRRK